MKKSTGIIRHMDKLGRVVIPKELRKQFDMKEGTPIEMYVQGSSIILKKYQALVCNNCGLKVEEEDKFCKHCGKEL